MKIREAKLKDRKALPVLFYKLHPDIVKREELIPIEKSNAKSKIFVKESIEGIL